eukprot:g27348.t1
MAPFEAALYPEENCQGQPLNIDASSSEDRCQECFDVCGKSFPDGTPMATANASRASGFVSQVRSLKVTKGAVHVSSTFCFGSYNFGLNFTGGRVFGEQDNCVSFQEPAHVGAVPPSILETVSLYFLKEDAADFDQVLELHEAPDLQRSGLFEAADLNRDQLLSVSEYASALQADLAQKAATEAFMGSAAMEAAAEAAQGPAWSDNHTMEQVLAAEEFGESYEEAKRNPEVGTITEPPPLVVNGHVVVQGGGSTAPVEFGRVDDESRVDGKFSYYDPQNGGEVMMCTEGKLYHAGFCYTPCRVGYDNEVFNVCFKTTCPSGYQEIAGGICKEKGLSLKTKVKEGLESYNRGQGVPPDKCTLGNSFGPGVQEDNNNRDFTLLIASDTQLPWCSGAIKSDWPCAIEENYRMVQAMHLVETLRWEQGDTDMVQKPIGVAITGDLTAYAHESQIQAYRKIWETREDEDASKTLGLIATVAWRGGVISSAFPESPIWRRTHVRPQCFFLDEELTWSGYGGVASCAQRMIAYIRSAVSKCSGRRGGEMGMEADLG